MGGGNSKSKYQILVDLTQAGNVEELDRVLSTNKDFKNVLFEKDNDGWTVIHWAASFKSRCIPVLLKHGSPIDILDNDGSSPLHLACRHSKAKATRLLIEAGCPINIEDKFKRIPLHRAARFANPTIIRILMAAGSRIDHCDINRQTPLFIATSYKKLDNVQTLLKYDAFTSAADKQGKTPLTIAEGLVKKNGQVASLSKNLYNTLTKHDHGMVPSLQQLCREVIQNFDIAPYGLPPHLCNYVGAVSTSF